MLLDYIRRQIPLEVLPEDLRLSNPWENRFRTLIYSYQNGSYKQKEVAKEQLVPILTPLARLRADKLLKKFQLKPDIKDCDTLLSSEHLVQVGLERVFKELDRFKFNKSRNSKVYITQSLHGAMVDEIRLVLSTSNIAGRFVVGANNRFHEEERTQLHKKGRRLTGQEIDDLIDKSLETKATSQEAVTHSRTLTMRRLHQGHGYGCVSLEQPTNTASLRVGYNREIQFRDSLIGERGLIVDDKPIWRSNFPAKDHPIYHLSSYLSREEMFILDLYYGLTTESPISMKEVGDKLGLSESRISQLHTALKERIAELPIIKEALLNYDIPKNSYTDIHDPLYQLLVSHSQRHAGFVFDIKDFAILKRIFKLLPSELQDKVDILRGVKKPLPIPPSDNELAEAWGCQIKKLAQERIKLIETLLDFITYEKENINELNGSSRLSATQRNMISGILHSEVPYSNGHGRRLFDDDPPPLIEAPIKSIPVPVPIVTDEFVDKVPEIIFDKAKKASEKGWLTFQLLEKLFKRYAPEIKANAIQINKYALEKDLIVVDYKPVLDILGINSFEYFTIRSRVANLMKKEEFNFPQLEAIVKEVTNNDDHSEYAILKFAVIHGWSNSSKLEKRFNVKSDRFKRKLCSVGLKRLIAEVLKEAKPLAEIGTLTYITLNEIIARHRGRPYSSQRSLLNFAQRYNLNIIKKKKDNIAPKPLEPLENLKISPSQIHEISTKVSDLIRRGFLTPSRLNRIIYDETGKSFGNERSIRHFAASNKTATFTLIDEPPTPFEHLDRGLGANIIKQDIYSAAWIGPRARGVKSLQKINMDDMVRRLILENQIITGKLTDDTKAGIVEYMLSLASSSELGILIRNQENYLRIIENLKKN